MPAFTDSFTLAPGGSLSCRGRGGWVEGTQAHVVGGCQGNFSRIDLPTHTRIHTANACKHSPAGRKTTHWEETQRVTIEAVVGHLKGNANISSGPGVNEAHTCSCACARRLMISLSTCDGAVVEAPCDDPGPGSAGRGGARHKTQAPGLPPRRCVLTHLPRAAESVPRSGCRTAGRSTMAHPCPTAARSHAGTLPAQPTSAAAVRPAGAALTWRTAQSTCT